jgi:hypothetical protein
MNDKAKHFICDMGFFANNIRFPRAKAINLIIASTLMYFFIYGHVINNQRTQFLDRDFQLRDFSTQSLFSKLILSLKIANVS